MISEFRDFLLRGNIVQLAVAVVIGVAFAALITSFTTDILTPLLGILGVPDFSTLTVTTPGGAVITYGNFLNAVITFLIVALVVFFVVVKPMNALEERRKRNLEENPVTKMCTECDSEIPLAARRCMNCAQVQPAAAG